MTSALIALSLAASGLMVVGVAALPDAPHRQEVEKWRAKHEADYRREYVGLAGLFSLKPGTNTIGSAASNDIVLPKSTPASAGSFILDGERVRFAPRAGVTVTLKGQPIAAPLELKHDEMKDGPDEILVNGVGLWVHMSGPRRTIRMRDDQGEVARSFSGFRWFPIADKYRVTGRLIKDQQAQQVNIPNQLGDDQAFTTEGVVEFTLDGQTVRLRPMTTRPNRLYFIFRDGTSGKETYETARFLYADLRSDGTTVLDFNEAYNPPCAFNPFTTCPLPPVENRLKVRILAGEKRTPTIRLSRNAVRLRDDAPLKVFLVHHAEAVAHEDDSRRPLSPRGEAQAARAAAEAAAHGAKPLAVWHSGKLRARQTAMAFWRACNALAEFSAAADLQPTDPPSRMRDRLRGESRDLLMAGHFPHLPRLLSLLVNANVSFPQHGVVAVETIDEGETWKELWRFEPD